MAITCAEALKLTDEELAEVSRWESLIDELLPLLMRKKYPRGLGILDAVEVTLDSHLKPLIVEELKRRYAAARWRVTACEKQVFKKVSSHLAPLARPRQQPMSTAGALLQLFAAALGEPVEAVSVTSFSFTKM